MARKVSFARKPKANKKKRDRAIDFNFGANVSGDKKRRRPAADVRPAPRRRRPARAPR